MTKSIGYVKKHHADILCILHLITYIAINNSTGFIVTFNIMLFYICAIAMETMSLYLFQN